VTSDDPSHQPIRDRVFVRDLLIRGILGINPDERVERQDILVNLEMVTDVRTAAASDRIDDAVNYRTLTKRVIERVETGSDQLVERLVEDLARLILAEFPVAEVTVRVEKPGALRFARSVGIEITRRRGREEG
jgi:FolB domain-containing protein